MRALDQFTDTLSAILLIFVGLLGTIISLLDLFGIDFRAGPWVWLSGPETITLLTVSLLAFGVGLERITRFRKIESELTSLSRSVDHSTEQIINALGGVSVRSFSTTLEYSDFLGQRISTCKKSVDDLTWGVVLPTFSTAEEKSYQKYLRVIADACKRGVVYREVMTFNDMHFVNRAEIFLSYAHQSYNLKFYDIDHSQIPPLLHCIVFDSEEVGIAVNGWYEDSPQKEVYMTVRHPDITRLIQGYFDAIWFAAKPLKIGDKVDKSLLEVIRRKVDEK